MKSVYRGSAKKLGEIVKQENAHAVLLFTGKASFKSVRPVIDEGLIGCQWITYNDFSVNPKKEDLERAIERLGDTKPDLLVAVGGGSVIDFAKAYRVHTKCNCKLVAVPTTFGSGSEVTQFAVLYVEGKKTSLDDPAIKPEYALVDSSFAMSQSPYLKACTGLDALCHAIESFWSVRSTEESREIARDAIMVARDNLVKYVNSDDPVAADNMAVAANKAGEAINITRTTAAHAFSYAFTQQYGIPHGHAVALTIAQVMQYNKKLSCDNSAVVDRRGTSFVCKIMDQLTEMLSPHVVAWFHQLYSQIGIEYDFRKLGIENLESQLLQVNMQRLGNNPVEIQLANFLKLFD